MISPKAIKFHTALAYELYNKSAKYNDPRLAQIGQSYRLLLMRIINKKKKHKNQWV